MATAALFLAGSVWKDSFSGPLSFWLEFGFAVFAGLDEISESPMYALRQKDDSSEVEFFASGVLTEPDEISDEALRWKQSGDAVWVR